MDIILATHNKNKVLEMEKALSSLIGDGRVLTAEEAGFTEDVEENGTTFEENALIKARSVSSKGCIAIADDSGLCCNALNGAPGIYSARYAGEHGNDKENNELLLHNLEKSGDREGRFVCVIACVLPDGREFCVRGETVGEILREAMPEAEYGDFHDRVTRDALLLWIRYRLFDRKLWRTLRARMKGGLLADPRHGIVKKGALACAACLFD